MARKRNFYGPRTPFIAARYLTGEQIDDMQGDKTGTEIQFAIHDTLHQRGFRVWPELRLPSRHHPSGFFRADLSLQGADDRVIALIECKRDGTKKLEGIQLLAYEDTGVPWRLATIDNAFDVLAWAEQFTEAKR